MNSGGKGEPAPDQWVGLPLPASARERQWASAVPAEVEPSIPCAMASASASVVPFLSIRTMAEASCARLASRKAGKRQRNRSRQEGTAITANANNATTARNSGGIQTLATEMAEAGGPNSPKKID